MRNPITYFSTATGSGNDDKKNIRAYKVKKAVDFLSLPEIRNIDALSTKMKFLKTRGLNEDEIKEAFSQLEKSAAPYVSLHDIASNEVSDENGTSAIVLRRNESSPFGTIFTFCHKLLVVVGVATSCYYLYKQWLTMKTKLDKSKKEDANIRAELRQIKVELLKIAGDMKQYQGVQENQTKLLAEVNSLKAILTSRQYFEEKKNTKSTMPSWQCIDSSQKSSPSSEAVTKEPPQSSQTNGHVGGIDESKAVPKNSRNVVQTINPHTGESTMNKIESVLTNGDCSLENETACSIAKESNGKSSSVKKRDSKKNDKKPT